jgi:hypothetical protein
MAQSERPPRRRRNNLKLWAFFFLCLLTPWDRECRSFAWEYGLLRAEQAYLYLCKFYLWSMLRLLRFLIFLSGGRRNW